jgi:hypothetical protein
MRNNKSNLNLVLINRKTKKVASNSSWLNALRAYAQLKGDHKGIAGLLAVDGKKYLRHNNVSAKIQRKQDHENAKARRQAKALLPLLAAIWGERLPKYKAPRRGDFVNWVTKAFNDRQSEAFILATKLGYNELIDAQRGQRWWLDQLKKMQS